MQVISKIEFYEKIKICEEATKKKKMLTGRPWGRPCKNILISSEIIIEEEEEEDDDEEEEEEEDIEWITQNRHLADSFGHLTHLATADPTYFLK